MRQKVDESGKTEIFHPLCISPSLGGEDRADAFFLFSSPEDRGRLGGVEMCNLDRWSIVRGTMEATCLDRLKSFETMDFFVADSMRTLYKYIVYQTTREHKARG